MENLNAEQVKKALGCCHSCNEADCKDCGYRHKADGEEDLYISCVNVLISDALALINKQETEYNELYEICESYRIERDAMRGAANSYKMYSKTLEKENETLKTLLDESYDTQNSLTEENERLSKEFVEYIKTAPIVKIDEVEISKFAIKRAIRNYELHFGKSAKLDQIAKEMIGDAE